LSPSPQAAGRAVDRGVRGRAILANGRALFRQRTAGQSRRRPDLIRRQDRPVEAAALFGEPVYDSSVKLEIASRAPDFLRSYPDSTSSAPPL
jgi:hypothetical protein